MNFSQGHSGTKVQCESCLFSQGKNTRIHKNGRNSWTFRFGPFFGLVCRGDSWFQWNSGEHQKIQVKFSWNSRVPFGRCPLELPNEGTQSWQLKVQRLRNHYEIYCKWPLSSGKNLWILHPGGCWFREEKNNININFFVRISRGHSGPLRPDDQGSKSFSPPPGSQENALFGADVHDFRRGRPVHPKGCRKNFVQKKFALSFAPTGSDAEIARNFKPCDLHSKMQMPPSQEWSSNLFEGLIFGLTCSVHFVCRRFGRLLWDSVEIAQNRRRTKCTEHTSKKIRPSQRLELYIFQSGGLFVQRLRAPLKVR